MKKSSQKKVVKGYALIVDGKLDIDYDIYSSKRRASKYFMDYRGERGTIVPCEIVYSLPKKNI